VCETSSHINLVDFMRNMKGEPGFCCKIHVKITSKFSLQHLSVGNVVISLLYELSHDIHTVYLISLHFSALASSAMAQSKSFKRTSINSLNYLLFLL
jgi:hypothetical protein